MLEGQVRQVRRGGRWVDVLVRPGALREDGRLYVWLLASGHGGTPTWVHVLGGCLVEPMDLRDVPAPEVTTSAV